MDEGETMPDKSMLSCIVIASFWPARDKDQAQVKVDGREQSDERPLRTRIADVVELFRRPRSGNGFYPSV
jgi:hypothetical protein